MNKSWKESDPEAPSSSSANSTFNETEFEPVSTTPVVDFSSFIDPFTGGLKAIQLPIIACFSAEATAERWRGFAGRLMTGKAAKKEERRKKIKTANKRKSLEMRRRKRGNINVHQLSKKATITPIIYAAKYDETTDESMLQDEAMEEVRGALPQEPPFRVPPGFKRIADDAPHNEEPPVKMSKIYVDIEDIDGCDLSSSAFRRVVCDNLEFWSDIADRIRDLDEKHYTEVRASRAAPVTP